MLKKSLFICFIFFSFLTLQAEEKLEQSSQEWKDIDGEELPLFVNSENKSKRKADGSRQAPFKSIEAAFTHLNGLKQKNIKATIYITGSFTSKNVYVITIPTRIVGLNEAKTAQDKKASSYISFEKNAGFVVTSSKFFLEKCTISRKEFVDEPRSVPILYSSNSFISLNNVTITAKEGGRVFRFIESSVLMDSLIINSNQNGLCNIIKAIKSNLKIKGTHFNCNGRFVIAIDSNASILSAENLHCNINAHLYAVVVKANNDSLNIQNSFFSVQGKYTKKDEAIIYDPKTRLETKEIELKGFINESKLEKD